jgi:hypothetical protein
VELQKGGEQNFSARSTKNHCAFPCWLIAGYFGKKINKPAMNGTSSIFSSERILAYKVAADLETE